MEKKDLKRHLKEYSIYSKRKTTINHAFASAISHFDIYEEKEVDKALLLLGQKPTSKIIKCVYCGLKAETWDHLEALVKDGLFSGKGHVLGNIVPACKKCNSSKGNKNWIKFIDEKNGSGAEILKQKINNYVSEFEYKEVLFSKTKVDKEIKEYNKIKEEIFSLMKKADEKAAKIRSLLIE